MFPFGDVHPVDWTDFDLSSIGEYQDQLPEKIIIQVEAGIKKFEIIAAFKRNLKIPLFGGSQADCWKAFVVPLEIRCNAVVGHGMAIFWYPEILKKLDIREIPTKIRRIVNLSDLPSPEKLLVAIEEKVAQSVLVAGGKGSSVAILSVIQETTDADVPDYRVPRGFIITVSAMDLHLEEYPEIKDRLRELEDIAYERIEGNIQDACKR